MPVGLNTLGAEPVLIGEIGPHDENIKSAESLSSASRKIKLRLGRREGVYRGLVQSCRLYGSDAPPCTPMPSGAQAIFAQTFISTMFR